MISYNYFDALERLKTWRALSMFRRGRKSPTTASRWRQAGKGEQSRSHALFLAIVDDALEIAEQTRGVECLAGSLRKEGLPVNAAIRLCRG